MAHDFRLFGQSVNGGLLSALTSAITHTRADNTTTTCESAIRENASGIATTKGIISDTWTSRGYSQGDYAIYNNTLYKCILTHASGITPTNTTYWSATTVGKALKAGEERGSVIVENVTLDGYKSYTHQFGFNIKNAWLIYTYNCYLNELRIYVASDNSVNIFGNVTNTNIGNIRIGYIKA